jgi:hypothetical protein
MKKQKFSAPTASLIGLPAKCWPLYLVMCGYAGFSPWNACAQSGHLPCSSATNLLVNGGFEDGGLAWLGGEVVNQPSEANSGERFAKVCALQPGANTILQYFSVQADSTYVLSFYAKEESTETLALFQVKYYSADSTFLVGPPITAGDITSLNWQPYALAFTAPSQAAFITIEFSSFLPMSQVPLCISLDDVCLTKGNGVCPGNLLLNPSFEQGNTAWEYESNLPDPWTIATEPGIIGFLKGVCLYFQGATVGPVFQKVPATAGRIYTVNVNMQSGNGTCVAGMKFLDNDGQVLLDKTVLSNASNPNFEYREFDAVAPAGTVEVMAYFDLVNPQVQANAFTDNWCLTESDTTLSSSGNPTTDLGRQNIVLEKIYPNPATQHVTLEVYSQSDQMATFHFQDPMGRMAHQERARLQAGKNVLRIPVFNWKAGIYHLMAYGEKSNALAYIRFVKM